MIITIIEMLAYYLLCVIIIGILERTGNDLIKLIGIIVLSIIPPFHYTYKLIIFGLLLQSMGIDRSKIYNLSALRRRFGAGFQFIGCISTLVGITLGVIALL
ncbi:hypothetical protein [uncultured Mitsuokella sp.]|uniref:hypothetical protein n=1 Tax=uncultured Mitsuokella sp. TaxID=453120 RepID=UPI002639A234|nr:hypothetical protein [uncultured Mitsuokella sp.]